MNTDRICIHRRNFRISDVEGLPLTFVDLPKFVGHVELEGEEPFFIAISSVADHHFIDKVRFTKFEKEPFRFL